MTRQQVAQILATLASAYPREQLSASQVKLWQAMLADLPMAPVAAATVRHIRRNKWFPSIAEICEGIEEPKDGDLAWAEVSRQIRATGRYGTPTWSTPSIQAAVEAIGWQTLCDSDNLDAVRAHWWTCYRAAVTRERWKADQAHNAPVVQRLMRAMADVGALPTAPGGSASCVD